MSFDLASLRQQAGALTVERDVILVVGPDSETFLQGQLSQDLSVDEGASVWSFVLQPQGKIDALVRVTRLGADRFALDVEGGFGDAVMARLGRFKLRVKCELTPVAWGCVAVRGPGVSSVDRSSATAVGVVAWSDVEGIDLLGPAVEIPAGVEPMTVDTFDALRIASGWPAMGRDLDTEVIPAESGLVPIAVSFTKGCFVGQELVARIDSRGGNVARHLRGLVSSVVPSPGDEVVVGDRVLGAITSTAALAEGGIGLAYVHRSVEPPFEVVVRGPHGERAEIAATVVSLPIPTPETA